MSLSTGKALGERERRGLPDLREAARAHVGQQGELKDLIALIPLLGTHGVFMRRCRHHVADDQAVRAEAVEDAVQRTFQEQITSLDQHPVHLAGGKGRQHQEARLGEVFAPGGRRQARQQHLRGARVTDREDAVPADVVVGGVPGAADEAVVVLPAQGHRQVLGREVVLAVLLLAPHDDQREHAEEAVPDGPVGGERDQLG